MADTATLTATYRDGTKKTATLVYEKLSDLMPIYAEYVADLNVVAVVLEKAPYVIAAIDTSAELPYDDHKVIYNIIG